MRENWGAPSGPGGRQAHWERRCEGQYGAFTHPDGLSLVGALVVARAHAGLGNQVIVWGSGSCRRRLRKDGFGAEAIGALEGVLAHVRLDQQLDRRADRRQSAQRIG
jgi:hypothetical protein